MGLRDRANCGLRTSPGSRQVDSGESSRGVSSDTASALLRPCECGSRVVDECGFCGRCGCWRPEYDRKPGIDDDVLEARASKRAEAFAPTGFRSGR